MRLVVSFALSVSLVAGCSDTPVQSATAEDSVGGESAVSADGLLMTLTDGGLTCESVEAFDPIEGLNPSGVEHAVTDARRCSRSEGALYVYVYESRNDRAVARTNGEVNACLFTPGRVTLDALVGANWRVVSTDASTLINRIHSGILAGQGELEVISCVDPS